MTDQIDPRRLFDVLPTPFLVLDRRLQIVGMNEAYLKTTQRGREELLGRYVFEAFPEAPDRIALFRDAFERALAGMANVLAKTAFSIPRPAEEGGGYRRAVWTCTHTPIHDDRGLVVGLVQQALDVTGRVEVEQRHRVMSAELDHRVKNMLAVVQSVGRLTARGATSVEQFLATFNARLGAMGRAHELLADNLWDGASLAELIERELSLYRQDGANPLTVDGPEVILPPAAAQTLSMCFHELATNAAKYGALSRPGGRLTVTWRGEAEEGDDRYVIEWRESGVGAVAAPARRGFGSAIIDEMTPSQLGGKVERRFEPDGLVCFIQVPRRR